MITLALASFGVNLAFAALGNLTISFCVSVFLGYMMLGYHFKMSLLNVVRQNQEGNPILKSHL